MSKSLMPVKRTSRVLEICFVVTVAGCGGGTDDNTTANSPVSMTAAGTTTAPGLRVAQEKVKNPVAQQRLQQLAPTSQPTEVAGASFEPSELSYFPPIGIRSPDYRTGQSFTATNTGVLSTVSLLLQPCSTVNQDISVEIRAGTSITNPVVATGTILGSSVGPRTRGCGFAAEPVYWATADLSGSQYTITAGQVYTIWPSTATESYAWVGNISSGYTAGNFIQRNSATGYGLNPTADVGFRTTVLVAP